MLLEKKRTEPSHSVACTPLGCRLRAAIVSSRSRLPATRLAQGGLALSVVLHDCSVRSGSGELGASSVSKCAPPPHQPNPRRSPPFPWIVSEMARVLLVPSVIS